MLLSFWPFSSDFFIKNWDVLGGGHYIALATGVNIALIGWEAFRQRVRTADRRLEAKINSVAASVTDSLDGEHYLGLVNKLLLPLLKIRSLCWGVVYTLAFLAALIGTSELFCDKSTPYNLWLLFPTIAFLLVSWMTLGIMSFWMWLMRKGMLVFGKAQIPSQQAAADQVNRFVDKAREALKSNSG